MASPYQSVRQRRLEEYERIKRANRRRLLGALVVASVAAVGIWQLLSSAQNTAAPESISVNDHDQMGVETTDDAAVMALPSEPVDDNHDSYSEAAPSPISSDNRPPEDTTSTDKPTVRLSVLPNPMKLRRSTLLSETSAPQPLVPAAAVVVDDTAHDKLMGKGAVLLPTVAMSNSNARRAVPAEQNRERNRDVAENSRNVRRETDNNRNQRSETVENSRNRNNSSANASSGGQSRTTPPATNNHEASRNRNASRDTENNRNQRSETAENSRNRNNASAADSGNTVRTTPPAAHPRNPSREASNNRNQNNASASNGSRAEAILNNRNPDVAANNRAGSSGGQSRNATADTNKRNQSSTTANNASRAEAILNNRNPDAAANNRAGSSGSQSRNATAAANNRNPNSATTTNNTSRAEAILNNRAAASNNTPDPRALLEGGSRRRMIQVGVYGDEARARDVQRRLAGAGISAYVAAVEGSGGKQYRVRTGTYPNAAAAEQAMAKIKMQGLDGIFLDR